MTELARFTAHGHPALRASHSKTLEITAETSVTARATCILGVAAVLPSEAMAGPIRLTLTAGSESITLGAMGNSAWSPGRSAVVRRSSVRRPDTYATDASLAAADLPRPFALLLADPSTELTVTVSRLPSPPSLIRFRLGPTDHSRLLVEARAADQVLAEDAASRAVLTAAGVELGGDAGGRTLSVSSGPGRWTGGRADEVIGWPVELAVLAAATTDSATVLVLEPTEVALVAAGNPGSSVVFRSEVDQVAKVLTQAGRPAAGVVWCAVDDPERPHSGTVADPDLPDRGEVIVRLDPVDAPAPATPVDPVAFVGRLLEQGVTARSVALALAALPGWSRRSAYDFVLSLQG